jgi:hypothetical protein
MSQTPPGTVKDTGAGAGDVLIGVDPDANPGLVVEVLSPQAPRDEGGRIIGPFKVLAPGSGRYAKGISAVLSEQAAFQNAATFIENVRSVPGCEKATHLVNSNTLRLANADELLRARASNPSDWQSA